MELLNALGINYKLLIAQFINFAILFLVLYKFGYKPMAKLLDERKNEIAAGIEKAEQAKVKLLEIEKKEKEVLSAAKKESAKIIEQAGEQAEKRRKEIIEESREQIGLMINQEKAKMQNEKAEVLKEIKKEVVDLVFESVEKAVATSVDSKKDKEIIKRSITEIN